MGNAQEAAGVQQRDVIETTRTKILSWNVTRFELSKIGVVATDEDPAGVGDDMAKVFNDVFMWWTITDLNPDIFILIEVLTPSLNQGTLAGGGGAQGVLRVLDGLRQSNPNWNLVPPVSLTGPASSHHEAIAVYYRSDRLSFTGPHYWPSPGKSIMRAQPQAAGAGPYLAPWNDCLRGDNLNRAAQSRYLTGGGSEVYFTQANERRPYYTTFVERRQAGARNINLVSLHLAPAQADALKALRKIVQNVPGWAPGYNAPNTVSVIIGDFNIQVADPATTTFMNEWGNDQTYPCKAPLTDWVFGAELGTMYKLYGTAMPADFLSTRGYDNAIVRYAAGTPALPHRGFVADLAYGQQDYANADKSNFPQSPATLAMAWNPLLSDVHAPSNLSLAEIKAIFEMPKNFGHVGVEAAISPNPGLSDHRPIYIEI